MPEPLRPPRREDVRRGRRSPPAAHGQRLDPATLLRPTRWARDAAGGTATGTALCDGRRTLEQVAAEAGLAVGQAVELLSALYAQGLLTEVGPAPVPALLFLDQARSLCLRLRGELLAARPGLEATFAGGAYSRRLAVGYLVEVTHVIRGAKSHIAAAIAQARDEPVPALLCEYLEDEHWHGAWMERALVAAGLDERTLGRALPLPATQAVLDSWRRAAHTDLLLYGGLIAITESGPEDAGQVEELFRRTVAQGVLPEAAWRPCFEHAFGDSGADHLAHSRALFAAAGLLSAERRDALRRGLLLHSEGVVQMEHAVLDFYSAEEGPAVHELEWTAE